MGALLSYQAAMYLTLCLDLVYSRPVALQSMSSLVRVSFQMLRANCVTVVRPIALASN
jgi:hypothetical protein